MKTIKIYFNKYVRLVLTIWGILGIYSYFQETTFKIFVGLYWWLFYVIPFLVTVGFLIFKIIKTKKNNNIIHKTSSETNTLIDNVRKYIPENEINDQQEKDSNEFDHLSQSLMITFVDGHQKSLSFSVICQINQDNAPLVISNYGTVDKAIACLSEIIESKVLSKMGKYTFEGFRLKRARIEREITFQLQKKAERMGFIITSFNFKELL